MLEPKVKYQVHIQDTAWQDERIEGGLAGTEGKEEELKQ